MLSKLLALTWFPSVSFIGPLALPLNTTVSQGSMVSHLNFFLCVCFMDELAQIYDVSISCVQSQSFPPALPDMPDSLPSVYLGISMAMLIDITTSFRNPIQFHPGWFVEGKRWDLMSLVDCSPSDDFTFHDWAVRTKTNLNDSISVISQALVLEHVGNYPIMSGCLTNNPKIHEITKHVTTS